jgi:hypothetical protein
MAKVLRRSTTALVVCCGLLLASQALVVSLPTSAASKSTCEALRHWAQPFSHTAPTLDQVTGYDRGHQKAIFNAVSPAVRSALFQEHLRRFDQRTDLTVEQHALITEARGVATAAFYNHDAAALQTFQQFWPRVGKAFPSQEQIRPWYQLGPQTSTVQPQSTLTMWDRLSKPFVARADNTFCDCSSGWTGECSNCTGGGCTQWTGCGPFLNWTCNGHC